jgi:hypothetical protein
MGRLLVKHNDNVGKANEELRYYRDRDETSEMAYAKWADIHATLEVALTRLGKKLRSGHRWNPAQSLFCGLTPSQHSCIPNIRNTQAYGSISNGCRLSLRQAHSFARDGRRRGACARRGSNHDGWLIGSRVQHTVALITRQRRGSHGIRFAYRRAESDTLTM